MCFDEFGVHFVQNEEFPNLKKDICNKELAISRGLVCQVLNALTTTSSGIIRCLDGNSPCGLMGMLWKKYLSEKTSVKINGLYSHSSEIIAKNLNANALDVEVENEDPCILMRKSSYDFIFLNCKTYASTYLDSAFSRLGNNGILVITTSDDPSLYWQSPDVALRRYSGSIVKTSYFRELGLRLVIAEMGRAAARYSKGITVLLSVAFKSQQSFTIIVRVEKGAGCASDTLKKINKLLHCSICEDRVFVPNSEFALESASSLLSCDCNKNTCAKTVNELGPVWSGDIFCAKFIQLVLVNCKGFPWEVKTKLLLVQILEEARCSGGAQDALQPEAKKLRLHCPEEQDLNLDGTTTSSHPTFYFSTHKHYPSNQPLQKVTSVIRILQKAGFRASRTHFDPESVRTNASLRELIDLLKQHG